MARAKARFRISIKDQRSGQSCKVELIEARGLWGEARFKVRVNGREAQQVKEANLTVVCDRLRRWLVARVQ